MFCDLLVQKSHVAQRCTLQLEIFNQINFQKSQKFNFQKVCMKIASSSHSHLIFELSHEEYFCI